MTDIFHEKVLPLWVNHIIATVQDDKQHTFLFLTKRPTQMQQYFKSIITPKNLWIGVTVENQNKQTRECQYF